ncbi:hypothetical protein KO481_32190 [Nocardia sp. NEAU-G5]|uniref:Uncharacterized protein n=1 Tax=Nocardia albiluteola TaxID=2842303 RepID=A0ABS6B8U0_9NOCA|nr:hypothetical protein [Nocardia albiluteola]MBU3066165.1 hypothetical protein [Nocardia albiluteola]
MATGVGLRIAEDECLAAIVSSTTPEPGAPAPEPLFVVREPILYMSDDGDTELGGDPPGGHSHAITGFVAAVGDPAGIPVDEGEAYRAEDLVATALFCLIDLAAAHLNGPAEFYAVHPAHWPAAQVLALRDALDYLGLRSVVLISESILPDVHSGREVATAAARGALASVLSTPAGAAPPDPTRTENSLESTDILPAIPTPEAPAQAYSAAIPVHRMAVEPPITSQGDAEAGESSEPPATKLAPPVVFPAAVRSRRTPLLIAAAAIIGLLLGGIVVAAALQGSGSPSPQSSNARSPLTPTAPVTTRAPATVLAPPPTTREPAQIPVHRPAPTTTPPPPVVTPPPATITTTPDPSSITATPSRPWRTPTTQTPFNPYNFDPFDPNTYDPFYPTNPTAPAAPYVWSPPAGTP